MRTREEPGREARAARREAKGEHKQALTRRPLRPANHRATAPKRVLERWKPA